MLKKIKKNKIHIFVICLIMGVITSATVAYAAYLANATEVSYDPSNTWLTSTTVQGALEELKNSSPPGKSCSKNPPVKLGDWVSYTPPKTSYVTNTALTGYTSTQTFNPSELNKWRVIAINNDGSVELISQYVSSTNIYFRGKEGYQNLAGYLNILARAYEDDGTLTKVGEGRHFGYTSATKEICNGTLSTSNCPSDTGYTTDLNLISSSSVLGTAVAYKAPATTTATAYWMASRYYASSAYKGRSVSTSGSAASGNLYTTSAANQYKALRPKITLKAGLSYSGAGTSGSPWVPSAS